MPAPKGNNFGSGNKGLHKNFINIDDFQNKVNEYFDKCDNNPIIDQHWVGKDAIEVEKKTQCPYTVEGLCLHLGNIDRRTLLNYQKAEGYEEYFHIVQEAKRRITENNIKYGLSGHYNANLVKFLLTNNTEYKDKTISEVTGADGKDLIEKIDYSKLSDETLRAIASATKP